jgi:hypothetical protein
VPKKSEEKSMLGELSMFIMKASRIKKCSSDKNVLLFYGHLMNRCASECLTLVPRMPSFNSSIGKADRKWEKSRVRIPVSSSSHINFSSSPMICSFILVLILAHVL